MNLKQIIKEENLKIQNIILETLDYRKLFNLLVHCKCKNINETSKIDFNKDLSLIQQQALQKLPIQKLDIKSTINWLGNTSRQWADGNNRNQFINENPLESIIHFSDNRIIYCNTEGYNYPRYTFEIINFPFED